MDWILRYIKLSEISFKNLHIIWIQLSLKIAADQLGELDKYIYIEVAKSRHSDVCKLAEVFGNLSLIMIGLCVIADNYR